jgi:hypothetical protein
LHCIGFNCSYFSIQTWCNRWENEFPGMAPYITINSFWKNMGSFSTFPTYKPTSLHTFHPANLSKHNHSYDKNVMKTVFALEKFITASNSFK